jgi:hypothetical protein
LIKHLKLYKKWSLTNLHLCARRQMYVFQCHSIRLLIFQVVYPFFISMHFIFETYLKYANTKVCWTILLHIRIPTLSLISPFVHNFFCMNKRRDRFYAIFFCHVVLFVHCSCIFDNGWIQVLLLKKLNSNEQNPSWEGNSL